MDTLAQIAVELICMYDYDVFCDDACDVRSNPATLEPVTILTDVHIFVRVLVCKHLCVINAL